MKINYIQTHLKVPVRTGISIEHDNLLRIAHKIDSENSKKALTIKFMERNGFEKEAWNYKDCGTMFKVYKCGCCGKDNITHTNSCNLRICPRCCKKQYWGIYNRLEKSLKKYGYERGKYKKFMLREITLTWEQDIQDCNPETLITDRRKQVNRLLSLYRRKGIIIGSVKVFETKRSSRDFSRIHIHCHILVISSFIKQTELSEKWNKISGNPIVWIQLRRTYQGLNYLLKHIASPPQILPNDIPLFMRIFKGRRRITTDGILWKIRFFDLTCDMEIKRKLFCYNCGSELDSYEVKSLKLVIQENFRGVG